MPQNSSKLRGCTVCDPEYAHSQYDTPCALELVAELRTNLPNNKENSNEQCGSSKKLEHDLTDRWLHACRSHRNLRSKALC